MLGTVIGRASCVEPVSKLLSFVSQHVFWYTIVNDEIFKNADMQFVNVMMVTEIAHVSFEYQSKKTHTYWLPKLDSRSRAHMLDAKISRGLDEETDVDAFNDSLSLLEQGMSSTLPASCTYH